MQQCVFLCILTDDGLLVLSELWHHLHREKLDRCGERAQVWFLPSISWKRERLKEFPLSTTSLCWKGSSLHRNLGKKNAERVFLPTIIPSTLHRINHSKSKSHWVTFDPCELRRNPKLHSGLLNWFLPGVPCASKYLSHPWFCEITFPFLFWFSVNKATQFRHFLESPSTWRRSHYSLLVPPFFIRF